MRKTVCECLDVLAHLCMSSTGEGLQRRSRSYNQDLVRAAGLIDLAYKLVVSFVDELKLPVRKIQAHLPDVHAICSKVYAFILCAIEGHAANKVRLSGSRSQSITTLSINHARALRLLSLCCCVGVHSWSSQYCVCAEVPAEAQQRHNASHTGTAPLISQLSPQCPSSHSYPCTVRDRRGA